MILKEYEGRALFKRYGIPVPDWFLLDTLKDADKRLHLFLKDKKADWIVLKAQVLSGKRGKGGGVIFAGKNNYLSGLKKLHRLTINGEKVEQIMVEEAVEMTCQYYLGIAVDRFERCPVLIFSGSGGVDVEETAAKTPREIHKISLNIKGAFPSVHFKALLKRTGVPAAARDRIAKTGKNLYELFLKEDLLLAEINPLALTGNNRLLALDSKIVIDENSLFRHADFVKHADRGYSRLERKARAWGLAYVELSGNLAIIGNGAGLVMATLDTVCEYGGHPANFCDVGGGATTEMMEKALETVLRKESVTALFINIFGGITRCDEVARGLVNYKRRRKLKLPMVVRMAGTNDKQAAKILAAAGIVSLREFDRAARKAADLSN